jgi:hypothetical protein
MSERDVRDANLDELEQQEPPAAVAAVPVTVDGPVKVQVMPATVGVMGQRTFGTTAEAMFSRELRRRRLVILAKTNPVIVATTQFEADNSNGFELAVGVALELTHVEAVWIKATTSTAQVNYVHELWAQ